MPIGTVNAIQKMENTDRINKLLIHLIFRPCTPKSRLTREIGLLPLHVTNPWQSKDADVFLKFHQLFE